MELGFLIPIVAIVMGISIPITAIKLKHREKIEQMRLAASGNRDDGLASKQEARIEVLEDRVRVLQRVLARGRDRRARRLVIGVGDRRAFARTLLDRDAGAEADIFPDRLGRRGDPKLPRLGFFQDRDFHPPGPFPSSR